MSIAESSVPIAVPVPTVTAPVLPSVAKPVLNEIAPLTPALESLPSAVASLMSPLEVAEP